MSHIKQIPFNIPFIEYSIPAVKISDDSIPSILVTKKMFIIACTTACSSLFSHGNDIVNAVLSLFLKAASVICLHAPISQIEERVGIGTLDVKMPYSFTGKRLIRRSQHVPPGTWLRFILPWFSRNRFSW